MTDVLLSRLYEVSCHSHTERAKAVFEYYGRPFVSRTKGGHLDWRRENQRFWGNVLRLYKFRNGIRHVRCGIILYFGDTDA